VDPERHCLLQFQDRVRKTMMNEKIVGTCDAQGDTSFVSWLMHVRKNVAMVHAGLRKGHTS